MFIGHFAVALAAKKVAAKLSLGTLFLSVQLLDLFWPIFLLLGLEHVRIDPGNTIVTSFFFYDYPITHSLLGAIGWSLLFAIVYFSINRCYKSASIVGAAVLSHWVLDLVTHRPDLPLIPGVEIYVGLGLWNSLIGTIAVEGGFFVFAIVCYVRSTAAIDRTGTFGFWGLVILLWVIWLVNLFSAPPQNETDVAVVTLLLWLFVPWGYWIDRHRQSRDDNSNT